MQAQDKPSIIITDTAIICFTSAISTEPDGLVKMYYNLNKKKDTTQLIPDDLATTNLHWEGIIEYGKWEGAWTEYANAEMVNKYVYSAGILNGVRTHYINNKEEWHQIYTNGNAGNVIEYPLAGANVKLGFDLEIPYYSNQPDYGIANYIKKIYLGNAENKFELLRGKTVFIEGALINGKPDGVWKMYECLWVDKSRNTIQINYKAGSPNGPFYIYSENNKLLISGGYSSGLANGQWIWQNTNGINQKKAQYVKGELTGEYLEYSETGTPISEYILKTGTVQQGLIRTVAIVPAERKYTTDYNGNIDINIKFADSITKVSIAAQGTKKPDMNYISELDNYIIGQDFVPSMPDVTGEAKIITVNLQGATLSQGKHINGKREGDWIHYYPDLDNITVVNNYKNGAWQSERWIESDTKPYSGKVKFRNAKGFTIVEIKVKKGLRNGPTILYDNDGKVISKNEYADGKVTK
ncbi:MAG: hypothetical protein SGJ04_10695 [Bacteroidota bacterium]|nr:hypothetical protein [Bacteroidota bacterium]